MSSIILDGKKCASAWLSDYTKKLDSDRPILAIIVVGTDPASAWYIKKKQQTCATYNIKTQVYSLSEAASSADLSILISTLNQDIEITGILLQLPLPSHLEPKRNTFLNLIHPSKDVDGLGAYQQGLLIQSNSAAIVSATVRGIKELLSRYQINLQSKHIVVVGASQLVGLPLSILLSNANATVTICHKYTTQLSDHTSQADILISATGVPHLITENHVKLGAIVIDVGIHTIDGKLTGDVDFAKVYNVASMITPVPGGVGPMTVAALIANLVDLHIAR